MQFIVILLHVFILFSLNYGLKTDLSFTCSVKWFQGAINRKQRVYIFLRLFIIIISSITFSFQSILPCPYVGQVQLFNGVSILFGSGIKQKADQ